MRPHICAVHPVLMSRDLVAALLFYERLGFAHVFSDVPDQPRYVGVRRDDVELHIQWHDFAGWAPGSDRPTYRFVVADVDTLREEFDRAGIRDHITPVSDTPWGTREFHVRDPDGNGLHFYRVR